MRVSSPDRGSLLPSGVAALILLTALAAGFLFRSWFSSSVMPPPPRMQGETTQAYRYSLMVADGEDIPAIDTLVMHPDGMRTGENSIFEEYVAGWLIRVTGSDPDAFLRFFCLLLPLLSIPLLYFWMRSAGLDRLPAAAGAALYAVMLPAILRARGESLYRETLALPMLVGLGWLTERSLSTVAEVERGIRKHITAAAPGIMLFLCLAAWKVTAFFSILLFVYLLFRGRRNGVPREMAFSLGTAQILASLLLTHMRSDSAIISPATVLALFLIVHGALPGKSAVRRWLPWIALTAAAAAVASGPGTTGHVGAVITAKVRFLFRHPADPSLLSPDARLFWVSGYTSPDPAQIVFLFAVPFLVAIPGIRMFVRRTQGTLLLWLPPMALAGYLFFDRLLVLLAVALIPLIACTLSLRRWLVAPVAALLLMQSAFPGVLAEGVSSTGLSFHDTSSLLSEGEVSSMLSWLRFQTDADESVLSFWHISGLISAYAGRPVVTHTFFENSDNRETIVSFARAVFQPEDSLLTLMRRKDADLLVYQADFLLDRSSNGLLYLAGLTSIPPDAAALEMHYHPEELDSLMLVFQGPSLRIFRRGGEQDEDLDRSFLFEERYIDIAPGYDTARSILRDPATAGGAMADAGIELEDPDMLSAALLLLLEGDGPPEVGEMMLNDLIQMYIQGIYGLDHLAEDAVTMAHHQGPDVRVTLLLARLYASEGRMGTAAEYYHQVLELDPGCIEAVEELQMTGEGKGLP